MPHVIPEQSAWWLGPPLARHPVPVRSIRAIALGLLMATTSSVLAGTPDDVDIQARCNLVFTAVAPAGETSLTYTTVDADTLASTLEAVLPYCGVKVMWFLTGQRIASGELDLALQWFLLAQVRTLLERMVDPRAFADDDRSRYRTLERVYGGALEQYRLDNPDVEREALHRALGWDRLYPSIAWPPEQWPGLHAEMRARLQRRLEQLGSQRQSVER